MSFRAHASDSKCFSFWGSLWSVLCCAVSFIVLVQLDAEKNMHVVHAQREQCGRVIGVAG